MKIKETVTAPIVVLITYTLYAGCFATPIAANALSQYDDYSLISGVVLEILVLLIPALVYAKCKGVGYSASMDFASFKPAGLIFILCMLVCALAGTVLISMGMYWCGIADGKYLLTDTYALAISERTLPVYLRCVSYAVIPAFAEELLYRGVLFTEYRNSGVLVAVIFTSALFALGQFSLVELPVNLFIGAVFALTYYVSRSLPLTVICRLAFNLLVFYFEDAAWTLILKRSNLVFFICFCAIILLLGAALALSEAQRMFYTRAIDGEKTPAEGKLKESLGSRLATAVLSPTFILCVLASAAIMLFL